MADVRSATAEEFRLDPEFVLGSPWIGADKPVQMTVVFTAATSGLSLQEARKRVHRADVAEQRTVAERFAARTTEIDAEAQVWALFGPEFVVTVVTERQELDYELTLHAIFVDLARDMRNVAAGDLMIRQPVELETAEVTLGDRVA